MQTPEKLISADSHVVEDTELWVTRLPSALRVDAPRYEKETVFQTHPGGTDPKKRPAEMAQDGVSGEVLYPSRLLEQFGMTDPLLQAACFRVYNDWLAEFCAAAPDCLFGVAAISTYDIDGAVAELTRCKGLGFRGILIWQVPPARFSFATGHYDRLWAAAQEAGLPVSLHSVTGAPYPPGPITPPKDVTQQLRSSVNDRLRFAAGSLSDLIGSGVFERFPRLKLVFVENEVSWIPFLLAQWDKYAGRKSAASTLTMLPSEYFGRQIYATFFNDPPTRFMLGGWGEDNCMWSNDFPHRNSTWPKSREVIARDLGTLPPEKRAKLCAGNVSALYGLPR